MKVNLIYDKPRMLTEMIHSVPMDLFMRRFAIYLKDRYPEYTADIDKAIKSANNHKTATEIILKGSITDALRDDSGFEEDTAAFCDKLGYNCETENGLDYGPGLNYFSLEVSPSRIPSERFSDTPYNNLYVRYSDAEPELIQRVGLRQMGHFYAYAVGRYVSLLYRISQELGLGYAPRQILEYRLNAMQDEEKYWGENAYAFIYKNAAYIDSCDSVSVPDIDAKGLEKIKRRLRGKPGASIRDLEKAVAAAGEAVQPVTIHETIPPEYVVLLSDDVEADLDSIDEIVYKK